MREGLVDRSIRALHRIAGLRVGSSSDPIGAAGAHRSLRAGEGLLFRHLGAALVHADPDQLASLQSKSGGELMAVHPERVVRTTGLDATPRPRHSDEAQRTWGLAATGITRSQFSGRGVRLAILDTGIDRDHPDFAERSIESRSFLSDPSVNDANGHGTYCAGIACGPSSPALPPRYGVASEAALYVGKVIGDEGQGADGDILAALDWSIHCGCAIICLSVGTPVARGEPHSPVYERIAQRSLAAGTVIVAAAGNGSLRPDVIAPVDHPANCPSILAVAAIDPYLRIAPFCCGGINPGGGEIDVVAPGVAVRSAWPRPELHRTQSGTSMATPYVVGIGALLAEARPSIRGRALRDLIRQTAKPLPLPPRDVGAGLIQAP